jgi:hypothetical protein
VDLNAYKVPPMFNGCDFAETTMPDGTLLTVASEPIILERGNVIFPFDWTENQRATFRRNNGVHGYSWPAR